MRPNSIANSQNLEANESFWKDHYQHKRTASTGNPSAVLVRFAENLQPGSALELGCSHGDDAIWLAKHGWRVVGVDISPLALSRASANAEAAGVSGNIDFQQRDLALSFPQGQFDLVSALYFHSPVSIPIAQILQNAAKAVAKGGLLLIAEHASNAPWTSHPSDHFPNPEESLSSLELAQDQWHTVHLGNPEREATGPGGQKARVKDNIIVLRRIGR